MILTTARPPVDLIAIAADVARTYGGNVSMGLELKGTRKRDGRHVYRLKLSAPDGLAMGARRSWAGRRGPWACWHVHRDVLAAILAADHAAEVRTGVATYAGAEHFLSTFATVSQLGACDCAGPDDGGKYVDGLRLALATP